MAGSEDRRFLLLGAGLFLRIKWVLATNLEILAFGYMCPL